MFGQQAPASPTTGLGEFKAGLDVGEWLSKDAPAAVEQGQGHDRAVGPAVVPELRQVRHHRPRPGRRCAGPTLPRPRQAGARLLRQENQPGRRRRFPEVQGARAGLPSRQRAVWTKTGCRRSAVASEELRFRGSIREVTTGLPERGSRASALKMARIRRQSRTDRPSA